MLNEVEARKENKKCRKIQYQTYRNIIDTIFRIKMDTSIHHNQLHIGYMERSLEGEVRLRSAGCRAPVGPNKLSKQCKTILTLIKNIARRKTPPEPAIEKEAQGNEIFQNLKLRLSNPICRWTGCEESEYAFGTVQDLTSHISTHVNLQLDTAPILKEYTCRWEDCGKSYQKHKLLFTHIKDIHTGEKPIHLTSRQYLSKNPINFDQGIKLTSFWF